VGASHLHAAGLDDLRTATIEAHAETAVALAKDAPRRRRLRRALRERLRHSAFVDPDAFTRDVNATRKTLAERRFASTALHDFRRQRAASWPTTSR
jgi:predicted O-linked N-acetylglucosamine transferase (SPINDLY family)